MTLVEEIEETLVPDVVDATIWAEPPHCDQTISEYFATEREVSVGQEFTIPLKPDELYSNWTKYKAADLKVVVVKLIDTSGSDVLTGTIFHDRCALRLTSVAPVLALLPHECAASSCINGDVYDCITSRICDDAARHGNSDDLEALPMTASLYGDPGVGKRTVSSIVARSLGRPHVIINCYSLLNDSLTGFEKLLNVKIAAAHKNAQLTFASAEAFLLWTENEPQKRSRLILILQSALRANLLGDRVVFFLASSSKELLSLRCMYAYEITRTNTECIKAAKFERSEQCSLTDVNTILIRTSLHNLANDTQVSIAAMAAEQLKLWGGNVADQPNISWSDIGGLDDVKRQLITAFELPLRQADLCEGFPVKGIVLHGPPGCGKTLLAKAVASRCSLAFFSCRGPQLINMYVGESEANVRRLFAAATAAAPSLIFFDEFDALAPRRGTRGDAGGVSGRIVSQLLTEMEVSKGVFLIAATNRLDLLDPSLLRPGRFDKAIELGPLIAPEDKLSCLAALTYKFNMPDVTLQHILPSLPTTVTGAELYGFAAEVQAVALERVAAEQSKGSLESDVCVGEIPDLLFMIGDFSTAARRVF